jgi:hypothetical protein
MSWGVLMELRRLKVVETAVEDLNCHFGIQISHRRNWCCSSHNRDLRQMKYHFRDWWNTSGNCKGKLNMRRISPKFVLYLVAEEKKQRKFLTTKNMSVARALFTHSIWPPVISSCVREWIRSSCEGVVSRIVLKIQEQSLPPRMWFQKVSFSVTVSRGKTAGPVHILGR